MLTDMLLLILSLALLAGGAEALVRGSNTIALRLGMTPMMAGLTIVAFGTSAPEMVVSLGATLNDQPAIAVGNVVGSNSFNVGIILGLTALIFPISVNINLLKFDAVIMVGVSLLLALLVWFGGIPRWMGPMFLLGLGAYTYFVIRLAKADGAGMAAASADTPSASEFKLTRSLVLLLGGLGLLIAGSRLLVDSAIDIARALEVSEAVIGLTIVAAGTSMPELAASVTAALRKQPDIAIGNVVGSNIFNILAILGVCASVQPINNPGIAMFDLWVMVAFAVATLPLMYTQLSLKRYEGVLLLAGYGAYLYVLWPV